MGVIQAVAAISAVDVKFITGETDGGQNLDNVKVDEVADEVDTVRFVFDGSVKCIIGKNMIVADKALVSGLLIKGFNGEVGCYFDADAAGDGIKLVGKLFMIRAFVIGVVIDIVNSDIGCPDFGVGAVCRQCAGGSGQK